MWRCGEEEGDVDSNNADIQNIVSRYAEKVVDEYIYVLHMGPVLHHRYGLLEI